MKTVVEYLIAYFFKFILWFRYRVKVVGLENLNPQTLPRKGGVIFLPNHPSYFIDPIVATLAVWPKYPIRPMVVEYMYYTPGVHGLMKMMNALPIPDFVSSSNSLKRKKSEQVIHTVIDDIKNGQNFLIYPAGKVKHTAYEAVGGASAVHRILHETPEANVVLVRIKGLWGSSFSRAILGSAPSLSAIAWEALKIMFKNLIFFTPRREITIELVPAPADFPRSGLRLEMNKYLENWYNQPDGLTKQQGDLPGDSLMLVSYSMWGDKFLPLRTQSEDADKDLNIEGVPEAIKKKVFKKIAELKECDPSEIKPNMTLASDLGLDSLDVADLVAFLNDQFDITGVPPKELTTVAKVLGFASKQIVITQEVDEDRADVKQWLKPIKRERAHVAPGNTIPEAFLNECALQGKRVACADARIGVQTYATLKLRAILLAEKIRHMPGKYIGIMLPASVAANLIILAVEIAGKVPLMVNWTVGPRHLESVVKLSNVSTVISSWAFLDRLDNVDLTGIEDRLLMVEDIVRGLTLGDKLKAFYRSKLSTASLLKIFGIDKLDPHAEAVLLFTSGTESMPKGVPLTHYNILTNMRASLESQEVFTDDIIFGILPPFHSFGFTIGGILGLISGIRIFYSPDPTDGPRLAKAFERWKVTLMVGAPTFIKGILKAATPEQVKTLRLCVSGAEKAPPELFQMLEQYGKPGCLIEGYGITECSPVLTMNPIGGCPKGVGKPLKGIELRIVHPETELPLGLNECGLILAKGPNIFKGYINPGLSSPFIIIDGETWYKTGDLGCIDENGILTISGRLKRFVKIGGEMVSLASIESALLEMAPKKNWPTQQEGPTLAVCAKEYAGEKTKIFLFSRFDLSADDVNSSLKEAGFSNLVRVASVIRVPEIPIMGTGKINYRLLESEYLSNTNI
jgi:long-chain-fatty-acid--[acyl-carrier-protein] ligase